MKITLQIDTRSFTELEELKNTVDLFLKAMTVEPKKEESPLPTYMKAQATDAQMHTINNAKLYELPHKYRKYDSNDWSRVGKEEAREVISHIFDIRARAPKKIYTQHVVINGNLEPLPFETEEQANGVAVINPDARARLSAMKCSVRDCFKRVKTKGLCQKHYMQEYNAKKKARKEVK